MEGARRRGALLLLKLARVILRGVIAFGVSGSSLRYSLSLVMALERMGAALLPGRRGHQKRTLCDKD